MRLERALRAFRIGTLAKLLPVMFQQEVGAGAGIKRLGQFTGDDPLLLAVGYGVVLALCLFADAEQNSRAVGRDSGNR